MSSDVSKYEDIGQSFLADHPIGTVVTASKLLQWVADHADGALLKVDLAILDPTKRLAAVRRHLNDGGRSDALAEDQRFQVQIDDAKRKTIVVRAHADIAKEKANGAIGKSILGALNPLKHGTKAIDAVKLEELPEIEQKVFEEARANMEAMENAIKPTLAQEVDRIWVARMKQMGIADNVARKIRESLPVITQMQKLLRATSK